MAALLALLTWGVSAAALALAGWPLAQAWKRNRNLTFRSALWFGLLLGTLVVLILGLLAPLGSSGAASGFGALLLLCAVLTWLLGRRGSRVLVHTADEPFTLTPVRILAFVAMGASVVYLAIAVAGPVTNYDTGLYHFGAINYAHDYSTVPGLANLFSPFGYNNSLFPLAAFLGNGPWDGEGFRLINGLFVSLLALDVTFRLLKSRLTVGTYVLLVCTGIALVPLVALSDFWVISPSSDPAVMILAFISLAYLSDAIHARSALGQDACVAVAAGVIAVSMRPLMAFFLILILVVVIVLWWRSRKAVQSAMAPSRMSRLSWVSLLAISFSLAVVQGVRDFRLSGWLQYPLAFVSFDVPWKAPNPTESQLSTLGYARDPERMHDVTHGWQWIPSWLERLPSQWEFALICALFAVMIAIWVLLGKRPRRQVLASALASAVPAALTIPIWFLFTPPAFRFAWGPIFGLLAVLIGWGLFAITSSERQTRTRVRFIPGLALAFGSVAVLGVVGYSVVARLDLSGSVERHTWAIGPIGIPYTVTPLLLPEVSTTTLESGLTIESPVPSDQCWGRYPLCSPQAPMTLRLQGADLQSGFLAE